MVNCSRCGQSNEASSRFCVACGSRLDADGPAFNAGPGYAETPPPAGGYPYPSAVYPSASPSYGPAPPTQHSGRPAETAPLPDASSPPLEPARSPTSGAPESARLAYAETAPPMLGEDVFSRKIPDRGLKQQRQQSSPDYDAVPGQPAHPLEPLVVPPDAPRVLAAFLISYEANPLGQSWAIHQGSNLLGRSGAVAGADLELPHATVSSRHALLTAAAHPGRLVITDFGSTNGTFVNDTALVAHEPRELRDGDRVRFGLFTAIVKII